MPKKLKVNVRNDLTVIEFNDDVGVNCALQEIPVIARMSDNPTIVLGGECEAMILTQYHVKQLLPYLKHFAKTGELTK